MTSPQAKVAVIGLVVTAALMAWKIRGSILIGIIAATIAGIYFGITQKLPSHWPPPSFANAFHVDLRGAMHWKLMPALFAVLMVDFFDTLGTATAIGEQAGLVDGEGRVMKIRQILIVDSLAASIGALFGASRCLWVCCFLPRSLPLRWRASFPLPPPRRR
jgi:AGZA family xanthine/uracil permease-like MFS transporter